MALTGGLTKQKKTTRLPGLPEDWRSMPENIDPRTGKPVKRRQARTNLAGQTPATGSTRTNIPGQSTQGLAPGSSSPATSPAGGLRSGGTNLPGGQGSPIASTSTISGPLGTLQPHGQIIAANDPQALYGQLLPGGSASRAAGFYAGAFDPHAIAAASGLGGLVQGNQDYLMVGQELANEFTGGAGAGKFLNPVQMMQNITQYAQQVMSAVRGGDTVWSGGPLAQIGSMDPPDALNAFISIVQGAMASTMPEDIAAAYADMLRRVGSQYIDQWMQNPIENDEMPGAGIINFLIQKLGPTMGLAGGNPGGMGTTQAQWAQAI